MAKIKRMPVTAFVNRLVEAKDRHDGYVLYAYGQNPRSGYLDLSVPESRCKPEWLPTGQRYAQYASKPKEYEKALEWRKNSTRVWDCNGLAEGIYQLFSGVCINSKSRYNYSKWCKPKGRGMIPVKRRVPGAAVFWSEKPAKHPLAINIHHVAYLWKPVVEGNPEGDWWLIEAGGITFGVTKSKLLSRKPDHWGWMTKYFDYSDSPAPEPKKMVRITGGTVNVRSGPGTSRTRVLGVVHKGDELPYQGKSETVNGMTWHMVLYKNQSAWVSGKYSRIK